MHEGQSRAYKAQEFRSAKPFDAALTFEEVKLAIREKKFRSPTDRLLFDNEVLTTDEGLWAKILHELLTCPADTNYAAIDTLSEILLITKQIAGDQYDYVNSCGSKEFRERLLSKFNKWADRRQENNEVLLTLWDWSMRLGKQLDYSHRIFTIPTRIRNQLEKEDNVAEYRDKVTFQVGSSGDPVQSMRWGVNLVMIVRHGKSYLVPRIYGHMMFFKCIESFYALLSPIMRAGIDLSPTAFNKYCAFLTEIARIISRFRNSGFAILKSLEGYLIGSVIREVDNWSNVPTIDALLNELALVDRREGSWIFAQSNLRKIMDSLTLPEKTDILGLIKLVGHPTIDIRETTDHFFERVNREVPIDFDHVKSMVALATKKLMEGHMRRYKSWPPHRIEGAVGRRLTEALLRNIPLSDLTLGGLPDPQLDEWNKITLLGGGEFNWYPLLIPLLKDKSSAPLTSQAVEYYLKMAFPGKGKQCESAATRSRVLIHYMLSESFDDDFRSFLARYSEDLESVLDYLIIKLTPKEKELKEKARLFGQTTLENRCRMVLANANLFSLLENVSTTQCFTLSRTDLLKKILALKKIPTMDKYKTHTPYFIHVDASGWNSMFRSEVVNPVGRVLDDYFGVKIYEQAHSVFEHTEFFALDTEIVAHWKGQLGGVEGLEQPLWSYTYEMSIEMALEELGYDHYGIMKADDTKILVEVAKQDIKNDEVMRNSLAESIQQAIGRIGQQGKTEETFISHRFLTFGKKWTVDKLFLPNLTKSLVKVHGYTDMTFPTLFSKVGTSFANAHASCSESTLHLVPYVFGLISAGWHISQVPELWSRTTEEKMALMLWPAALGGLPILYYSQFLCNTESDHISNFLSFFHYSKRTKKSYCKILEHILNVPMESDFRMLSLAKDPYALPIRKPAEASQILKKVLKDHINRMCKNREVRTIFSENTDLYEYTFEQYFAKANILVPKIMNVVLNCSPSGLREDILNKFLSSQSIVTFLIKTKFKYSRVQGILRRLVRAEQSCVGWRIKVLSGGFSGGILSGCEVECSTEWARAGRELCWSKPVEGVTYPSFREQFYFRMSHETSEDYSRPFNWINNDNSFHVYVLPPESFLVEQNYHFAQGSKDPFIGKTTGLGCAGPSIVITDASPALERIMKLVQLYTFTNIEGNNITDLILLTLKQLTDIDLSGLFKISPRKQRGTTTHRLRARGFKESITINEYPNRLTMVWGDTSHNRENPLENVTLNYLEAMVNQYQIALHSLETGHDLMTGVSYWFRLTECQHCLSCVDDMAIVSKHKLPQLFDMPSSNVLKITGEERIKVARKVREFAGSLDISMISDLDMLDDSLREDVAIQAVLQRFFEENRLGVDKLFAARSDRVDIYTIDPEVLEEATRASSVVKSMGKHRLVTASELQRIHPIKFLKYLKELIRSELGLLESSSLLRDLTLEQKFHQVKSVLLPALSYCFQFSLGPALVDNWKRMEGPHSFIHGIMSDLRPHVFLHSVTQQVHNEEEPTERRHVLIFHGIETFENIERVLRRVQYRIVSNFGRRSFLDEIEIIPRRLHCDLTRITDVELRELGPRFVEQLDQRTQFALALLLSCSLHIDRSITLNDIHQLDFPFSIQADISSSYDSIIIPTHMIVKLKDRRINIYALAFLFATAQFYRKEEMTELIASASRIVRTIYDDEVPMKVFYPLEHCIEIVRDLPRSEEYILSDSLVGCSSFLTSEDVNFHMPGFPCSDEIDIVFWIKQGHRRARERERLVEGTVSSAVSLAFPTHVIPEEDLEESWLNKHAFNFCFRAWGGTTSGYGTILCLVELARIRSVDQSHELPIMCLGDGEGGISSGLTLIYKNAQVYYQSLVRASPGQMVDYSAAFYPGSRYELNIEQRGRIHSTWATGVTGDLTNIHVWTTLVRNAKPVDIIICTPELNQAEQYQQVINNVFSDLRCLKTDGIFAIAVPLLYLWKLNINLFCNRFRQVFLIPDWSSHENPKNMWVIGHCKLDQAANADWFWPAQLSAAYASWITKWVCGNPMDEDLIRKILSKAAATFSQIPSRACSGLVEPRSPVRALFPGPRIEEVQFTLDNWINNKAQMIETVNHLSVSAHDKSRIIVWLSLYEYYHRLYPSLRNPVTHWQFLSYENLSGEIINYGAEVSSFVEFKFLARNSMIRYFQLLAYKTARRFY